MFLRQVTLRANGVAMRGWKKNGKCSPTVVHNWKGATIFLTQTPSAVLVASMDGGDERIGALPPKVSPPR